MTPVACSRSSSGLWRAGLEAVLLTCIAAMCAPSHAQPATTVPRAASKAPAEQGVRWGDLKPAQQAMLSPLERQWSGIAAPQKQKWLELSARFPKMTPPERDRVRERMAEWARLTPQERGQARLNFQEAKQLPAQDRQARWDAYQALSPEEKQQLAARAAPAMASDGARKPLEPARRVEKGAREPAQAKSNIVPNPAFAAPPKAIAPTVLQAGPGVSTTPITRLPMPPSHEQTGLPKIAATPGFVNKATLLPQRGPQGAAARSAAAAASEPSARQ